MRKRTKARECALQILYAVDVRKEMPCDYAPIFWGEQDSVDDEVREFCHFIVDGAYKNREEIDRVISKHATNWQIQRMPVVDRNILRIATFELLFAGDIPPKVSINEAIDIAKRYGDTDSGKFVNGVLDKINKSERKED